MTVDYSRAQVPRRPIPRSGDSMQRGVMIKRHPDGTAEIPFPHKIVHWRRGGPTLQVEVEPSWRRNPPQIDGWRLFFIGYFGVERPMHFSYKRAIT